VVARLVQVGKHKLARQVEHLPGAAEEDLELRELQEARLGLEFV
jgi:hypothetical protein